MSSELIPSPINPCPAGCRTNAVRHGSFRRKSDGRDIPRYRCKKCGRTFSDATFDLCFGQKKRHVNPLLFKLMGGGFSQRRTALDFDLNRKTVVRKFIFLSRAALYLIPILNQLRPKAKEIQFDDLVTAEHTKLKPISVIAAVVGNERWIIDFRTASAPASGKLAQLSRDKYGKRPDDRKAARRELFTAIRPFVEENAVIKSDQSPHYPSDVAEFFPGCTHKTYKGRRGCVVGQGELKRGGYDPIFSLNHTFAMCRANMNRLFRRTWCTTKKIERLHMHLALYTINHNLLTPAEEESSRISEQHSGIFVHHRLTNTITFSLFSVCLRAQV